MLSTLPNTLTQLRAENNSEKLKNVFIVSFKKVDQKDL